MRFKEYRIRSTTTNEVLRKLTAVIRFLRHAKTTNKIEICFSITNHTKTKNEIQIRFSEECENEK